MKELFQNIFEYHHFFNQKLIEEIKIHFNILPSKTYPLFCHVLNAHQIWNARILGIETVGVRQLHELESCPDFDKNNYSTTIQIIENADWDKLIPYQNSKGDKFKNSVRDILFHVANHSTHHKGQIIADFRSVGVEPLITDYIFYRRQF